MTAKSTPLISQQILNEAASWFVEFRVGDDDASAHQQFDQWLRRSPEHVQAYLELTGVWTELSDLPALPATDIERLIALARSSAKVVSIGVRPAVDPAPSKSWRRSWIAVAVAASLCAALLLSPLVRRADRTYATETGEQRSVTLPDGSTVDLNARSRIVVRFANNERDVRLVQGQALFRVAKDKSRPFVVKSESAIVRAVGTMFDVDQREHEAVVTVLEGRVIVAPDAAARRPVSSSAFDAAASSAGLVYVTAGEQITVGAAAAATPVRADVIAATSWTRRELTFDNSRLGDVVSEFNRFNNRQIVIEDQRLSELKITGVYSSTNPDSLLRFLSTQPGIVVAETDSQIRIQARPAP